MASLGAGGGKAGMCSHLRCYRCAQGGRVEVQIMALGLWPLEARHTIFKSKGPPCGHVATLI